MNLIKIENIHMPELEIYHSLRESAFRDDKSFVADSPKVANMLLKTSMEIKSILATPEYYDAFKELITHKNIPKLFVTDKKEMQKIVGHKIHHNVMMHGIRPDESSLDKLGDTIIMVDNISSSENIGSIARSAAALGINSFVVPQQAPHPYNRRALRVSMGHVSMLNIHIYEEIISTCQALKNLGYKIFAAEVQENSTPLRHVEVPQKWVLLMGNEGKGLSQEILDVCDEVVTIEMLEGVKSFNVSVAASIMMYQFKNRASSKILL
ncbi:MAG: RNA methyltransferase [Campylobacterales bacterium]|nr:RNA methyltransferase [Campylobacterales bacterium]